MTRTPRSAPAPMQLRGLLLDWGARTYVMGILNVTPDSFSGDGLATAGIQAAVAQAMRMIEEGADLLDIGGESTRPGHARVDATEERRRVIPVVTAIRDALPDVPLSVDTTKPDVAMAALDAGADVVNDVTGVSGDGALARITGQRQAAYVLMHDRTVPPGSDVAAVVVDELRLAVRRAELLGCPADRIVVDPGIGFGKTAQQNLDLLRELDALCALGRPVLLGASRKSTIGRVLDLPADQRLEGTLATTALGIGAGVDIVRVHDVRANHRVARMSDAIVRGWHPGDSEVYP